MRYRRSDRALSYAGAQYNVPSTGTAPRTKALLEAALRLWELKHRVDYKGRI